MTAGGRSGVGERWIAWVFGLAAAAPLLVAPYPPMTDFPHHESLVALLRTFGDPSRFPPGMYVMNLGEPNQLFHLLAWPLAYVMPVTLACKVVAAASVASIPIGGARLARHLGASAWMTLTLVPIALGWLFSWGFVNNLMALGILLAFLPALDRFAKEPTWRRALVASAGAALLYFAHELVMFVYVGAALIFAALYPLRLKQTAARVVPALLGIGMAIAQILWQEHLKTATVKAIPNVFFSLDRKLIGLPATLVGFTERVITWTVFGSCVLVAVVFALEGRRMKRENATATTTTTATANATTTATANATTNATTTANATTNATGRGIGWLQAKLLPHRFLVLAAGCLALFVALPISLNGATLVYQRFLAPAYALLVILAGVGVAESPRLLPRALALVPPLAALLLVWPSFAESSQVASQLETLLARIPKMSSVAGIDLDTNQAGRAFSVASGLSRVLGASGGRVLYSFTDSTVAPVMMAPEHQWNEPAARVMTDNYAFRPAHDLTRFRYLLVHSSDSERMLLAGAALQPEAEPLAIAGEWALFESTLDVVPITAPDAELATPKPPTLRKRMEMILRSMQKKKQTNKEAP